MRSASLDALFLAGAQEVKLQSLAQKAIKR